MPAKRKPIYGVYCNTKTSFGLQWVKADNKIMARAKFARRFPKQRILSIDKADTITAHIERFCI